MELPTVKIARPDNERGGYAIINEADFDPDKHKLFDEEPGDGLTREDIAAMGKRDVRELLEGHGVDVETGATVAEMRELAVATLFVEL